MRPGEQKVPGFRRISHTSIVTKLRNFPSQRQLQTKKFSKSHNTGFLTHPFGFPRPLLLHFPSRTRGEMSLTCTSVVEVHDRPGSRPQCLQRRYQSLVSANWAAGRPGGLQMGTISAPSAKERGTYLSRPAEDGCDVEGDVQTKSTSQHVGPSGPLTGH